MLVMLVKLMSPGDTFRFNFIDGIRNFFRQLRMGKCGNKKKEQQQAHGLEFV